MNLIFSPDNYRTLAQLPESFKLSGNYLRSIGAKKGFYNLIFNTSRQYFYGVRPAQLPESFKLSGRFQRTKTFGK
jgi:hypothetical protein